MPPIRSRTSVNSAEQEGRILLAIQALKMEILVVLLLLPGLLRYRVQHYATALMAILNEALHAQIRVN
jgi:hypothetical protein